MANQLVTEILLDIDKLREKLKEAEGASQDSAKKVGNDFGKSLEGMIMAPFSKLKSELLGIGAAVGAGFALKSVIEAANDNEKAINRLNAGLRANGSLTNETSARAIELADSLSKTSFASKDALLDGEALLASLGRLSGDGLERATKDALLLSKGLQIDVSQAFNMVAKAANGHVSMLNRVGLKIRETGLASYDYANALHLIESRFGALAGSGAMNTFSGSMNLLKKGFTELQVSLGDMIIKSPAIVAVVKTIATELFKLSDAFKTSLGGKNPIDSLVRSAVDFADAIVAYVIRPIEVLWNIMKTGVQGIATIFLGLEFTFLKVGQFFFDYIEKPILDFIGNKLGKVIAFFSKDAGDSFASFINGTTDAISHGMETATTIAKEATGDFATATAASANAVLDQSLSTGIENFTAKLRKAVDEAKPLGKELGASIAKPINDEFGKINWDMVVAAMHTTAAKIQINAVQIAKTLNTFVVNGLSSAFSALGGALVKGENVFEAFGKSVLKSMGALLIQFGNMLIAIGVGLSTVPMLFGFQGAAAIAAGIAASVLGGALEALGGGGGGGGPVATAGGGVAGQGPSSPGYDTNNVQALQTVQKQEPTTQVHVNIQGNVLDRRETGLAIAEVIQDTFGSNGITFATAGA